MTAMSRGHGNFYVGGSLTAGGFGISRVLDNLQMGTAWGSSQLSSVGQMAIVVAPENSTLLGLCLGLASIGAIARRRRTR